MSRVTELIETLKDEDASVRTKAIEKLGIIKDLRAMEPLIDLLEKKDVCSEAVTALDKINPDWRNSKEAKLQVSELIATLLDEDEDNRVRSAAAYALGSIRDPRAVEPLIDLLEDEDYEVRSAAAYALGSIRDPQKWYNNFRQWYKWLSCSILIK